MRKCIYDDNERMGMMRERGIGESRESVNVYARMMGNHWIGE